MREDQAPPSTGGARGGSRSSDVRICLSVCNSESGTFSNRVQERTSEVSGAPARKIVQGRARGVSSGAGAADDDRSRRYMLRKNSHSRAARDFLQYSTYTMMI